MGFSTGQSNPDEYVIGRGVVHFASVNSAGFPLEFRDLGNAPEFSASLESETIPHQSSRQGLKVTDKEVTVSLEMSISFTLDQIDFDNLAMYLSGNTSELAQTGATLTGTENVKLSEANSNVSWSHLNKWYDLYGRQDMSGGVPYPGDALDARAYNLTSATVAVAKTGGGGLTETSDFVVDRAMGRVLILDNAANRVLFPIGTEALDVDFATETTVIEEVAGLTNSDISGALKFIQKNAANSSKQVEYQFHSVTLAPEGDLSMIGDEYATMQFTGKAEAREAVDPTHPIVRVRTFEGAGVA
ncbi:MAG: hypothetical protein JKY94_17515 [Rhodobacteraceae bacterium]|nr:hypothetical protein [Paracoccaceae bacterium]